MGLFAVSDPPTERPTVVPRYTSHPRNQFQRPGSRSALRKASQRNPLTEPCPTCNTPNRLTPADVRKGYQCDQCADREEGACS
jgi:hypothetical protein